MSNATKLPDSSTVFLSQWSRPDAPLPKLDSPCSATATILKVSTPFKDKTGAIVPGGFEMGIRKANGWTETVYVPVGAVSADGYTLGTALLPVVRGVRPSGYDYTTGDPNFADSHDADEPVFCNIPANIPELIRSVLQGLIATGGTNFILGVDATGTVTVSRSSGTGTYLGFFRWSNVSGKAEFSNDGSAWNAMDNVTGSNLVVVDSSDTTPGNLNNKMAAGTGITLEILNVGGNEQLRVKLTTPLAAASDAQVAAGTGSSGGNTLFVSPTSTTVSTRTANKVVVTDPASGGVNTNLLDIDHVYYPLTDVYGETITAPALVYRLGSDQKWYNVTSATNTQFNVELGIALDSGTVGQTGKRILKEGSVTGLTFSNINPTFLNIGTATTNNLGDTTTGLLSSLVDNSSGAESVISGGTVSVRHQGTGGDLGIYLVLEQQDQSNTPACFYDSSNHVARGAVIASATIASASISGVYQDLPYSYGGNIKIPAGARVYEVYVLNGAQSGTNYLQIQSTSALQNIAAASPSTWSGTATPARRTLTVVSTSPIGYSVKAYTGSNGSFGLTPSGNPWSKTIGIVTSATTMYFNPKRGCRNLGQGEQRYTATVGGMNTVDLGFCPDELQVFVGSVNVATASSFFEAIGYLRGDNILGKAVPVSVGFTAAMNFLKNIENGPAFANSVGIAINGIPSGPAYATQNFIHFVRLENGVYAYIGFPTGANYLSVGNAGWSLTNYGFSIFAFA